MEHPFRYILDNTYFLLIFIKEKHEEQMFGGLKCRASTALISFFIKPEGSVDFLVESMEPLHIRLFKKNYDLPSYPQTKVLEYNIP